jgi:hypothetical protein
MLYLLTVTASPWLHAAEPAPPAPPAGKTDEKPAVKLPDLAVTRFALSTGGVDRARSQLLMRIENIGNAPSARTGVIVDCRLPDKENRHCPGTTPPPRFHLPPLPVGDGRDFSLPLSRFLPAAARKERYELRARIDTGARIQESNRYNNFRKLDVVY